MSLRLVGLIRKKKYQRKSRTTSTSKTNLPFNMIQDGILFKGNRVIVPVALSSQEKKNGFPILGILGYLKNTHKIPNLVKRSKSQSGNSQPSSQIGICLTLPNVGFLWVFFKCPQNWESVIFFLCVYRPLMVKKVQSLKSHWLFAKST